MYPENSLVQQEYCRRMLIDPCLDVSTISRPEVLLENDVISCCMFFLETFSQFG
uniref:Uncharacterized protein n=1 Tax=Anguilla anguilla TaxID=7936 RepID=A0A0E9TXW4_ANGAN